jgi:AcrR family transcriptional regulator
VNTGYYVNMVYASHELSPRRSRKRLARSEEILAKAQALLAADGFEAITIQRIADQLDWTKGALYRYFRSKDAIVAELQVRAIGRLGERLRQRLSQPEIGAEPLLAVLATIDEYVCFAADEPATFGLLARSIADPAELLTGAAANAVVAAALDLIGLLAQALARAGASRLPNADAPLEQAVELWATLQGILQLRKISRIRPDAFPVDRLARQATSTLLLGWGTSPDRIAAGWDLLRPTDPKRDHSQ